MRKAVFDGQFYPLDKITLRKEIKNYVESAEVKQRGKVFGLIVPHAGYGYSGKTAAYAYGAISEQEYDVFVILGPNHTGIGSEISISQEDFKTPLGIAENDRKFGKELSKLSGKIDESAHENEHSIEVQLPFLQYLYGKIKIVPIVLAVKDHYSCIELGKAIASVAKKLKKKICIIASSDFTHYGRMYGFMPFAPNREMLYRLDIGAIGLIAQMKSKEFLDYCAKTTICGAGPIAAAIEAAKIAGAKKGSLLNYSCSGDVNKDYANSVGYASMIFE